MTTKLLETVTVNNAVSLTWIDDDRASDDIICYYDDKRTLQELISSNLSKFIPIDNDIVSLHATPLHTGVKHNPYKFAKTYIRTALDIIRGIRDPIILQLYSSLSVYKSLENTYVKSLRQNISMLPLPIKILSINGYRVNKLTSEMSAVVEDNGEIKICLIRAEYSHEKWKVTYFGVICPKRHNTK